MYARTHVRMHARVRVCACACVRVCVCVHPATLSSQISLVMVPSNFITRSWTTRTTLWAVLRSYTSHVRTPSPITFVKRVWVWVWVWVWVRARGEVYRRGLNWGWGEGRGGGWGEGSQSQPEHLHEDGDELPMLRDPRTHLPRLHALLNERRHKAPERCVELDRRLDRREEAHQIEPLALTFIACVLRLELRHIGRGLRGMADDRAAPDATQRRERSGRYT